jgi:hypothetical protein
MSMATSHEWPVADVAITSGRMLCERIRAVTRERLAHYLIPVALFPTQILGQAFKSQYAISRDGGS